MTGSFALVLETDENLKVGYCPRYLNKELRRVQDATTLRLIVEKVNPEAPLHFRLSAALRGAFGGLICTTTIHKGEIGTVPVFPVNRTI